MSVTDFEPIAGEHERRCDPGDEPAGTRVLGVDLGTRRIGLALSDASMTIAGPLTVLQRSGNRRTDHEKLLGLARREGAGRIVVGLPISLSGEVGPAGAGAIGEADELRDLASQGPAPVEVELYDERMTTVIAHGTLREAGVRAKRRKGLVDKVAAAVMLQSYLDSQSRRQPGDERARA